MTQICKDLKRGIKHWWQRNTRGFDDAELWNLDETVAEFMLPRLKAFREMDKAFFPAFIEEELEIPSENKQFSSEEFDEFVKSSTEACVKHWDYILGEMIFFLEKNRWEYNRGQSERYQKASELFGKYFWNLWD